MKRVIGWRAVALLLGLTAACSDSTGSSETRTNVRVLLIGNSYTLFNGQDTLLARVAVEAGHGRTISATMGARNNQSLETLWKDGVTLATIRQGGWDYVVLQEWVWGPTRDPNGFENYARMFDTEIKAQGGKTVLVVPWAPNFMPDSQTVITNAVKRVASLIGARVAAAGPAWMSALQQKPSLLLYYQDGAHPDVLGSYLTAAVVYATIFRESPESSAGSVDQQRLRKVAWAVEQQF
ncbi:MAG TPA: hypothetical protein VM100_03280 [Longimicrobiales bacterium]|nr:hypothetical protein [Longimicrobiales bacterium]